MILNLILESRLVLNEVRNLKKSGIREGCRKGKTTFSHVSNLREVNAWGIMLLNNDEAKIMQM